MRVRVLREEEIRDLIDPAAALGAARGAFARLGQGEVVLPEVMFLDLAEQEGEVHGKGAYISGSEIFVLKVASGFYRNPERGLPISSGAVFAFDAATGFLDTILFDNGFLTELRTGAAGALATDLLARQDVKQVGIFGCGAQARYQLEAHLEIRTPSRVVVYCRTTENAAQFAAEMSARHNTDVVVAQSPEEAARGSDVVITTTPARSPVVEDAWVEAGTHITAIGSDVPEKHELHPSILARGVVVADSLAQCLTQGEIHHAVESGVMTADDVRAELGDVAAGLKAGRTADDEITVADLTGVGVLDAAVAEVVVSRARSEGRGSSLDV